MLPDFEAKVPERDWFVVGDEESFARSGPCSHDVFDGKDVRVSYVIDVGNVPQVVTAADNEWCFVLCDAGVDGWDELIVIGAEDDRGTDGTR